MFAFFSSVKQYLTGILGVFLLIACVVATIALLRTPVFEAEARIKIPNHSEQKASSYLSRSMATTDHRITLQKAVDILQNKVLAEQVITTIGRTELFPDLAQNTQNTQSTKGEAMLLSRALTAFQQQLTITPIRESHIIKITFQHADAEMTVQVVETLLRLFQKECIKLQPVEEGMHNGQLLSLYQKMHQATYTLSMFKQRNQLFRKEEKGSVVEEYDRIKALLPLGQKKLDEQLKKLSALEEQFASKITSDKLNSGQEEQEKLTTLLGEGADLIHLKIYEQELIKKYGQGSSGDRLIKNVRLQIASLQNALYAETSIPETELKQIEAMADQIVLARKTYHEQQKKINLLQRRSRQLEDKLQRIADQETLLAQLRQKAEAARERYTTLVAQLETEQQVREGFKQIQTVDWPVIPIVSIEPKKKSALVLAFISGLLGSLLYGILQLLRHRNNRKQKYYHCNANQQSKKY
ncbi:MAG: hypothetical protein D3916_10635 [Candidatus Electrothrix sp. MAN1_4]|nr:hypothetical protein [Candidatus Electrothrix sp. MAN1_4]